MKKFGIIAANILIIAVVIIVVAIYVGQTKQKTYLDDIDHFRNLTDSMEKVTENYLEGEQHICDVWTHHINSSNMTLEEATEFVRDSHVHAKVSAHLILVDTMRGLSTRLGSSNTDSEEYSVSYKNLDLFPDMEHIGALGERINITVAYPNPQNGVMSIAFYNKIDLVDSKTGEPVTGLLLRVVPISELESKWVYPQERYNNVEFSMIDSNGGFVIKGTAGDISNFYDYYDKYNGQSDLDIRKELADNDTGTVQMVNGNGEECIIAHATIESTDGWNMISYILKKDLKTGGTDWVLIGLVAVGLFLLFTLDAFVLSIFNRQLHVAAKTAEEAQQAAEVANKAKTDFLSTMSHDIRTPMNAIIGLTTIAQKNIGDPAAVGDCLNKVSMASNHLLTLINDILDISKVESGKLNLSPVTFSIVETTSNLVNLSQPMVKEKNIDFSFRINRMEKEYLYADQLRLNQVFINILSNAIKYTEPYGKVSVDMKEEPGEKENTVRLTYVVSDTGIGMSEEFMSHMYQPFSRQVDSRVNTIQGTGLGLTITKKMVDMMGGTIDCKSKEGEGTTFTVIIDIPVSDRQLDDMKLDPVDVLLVDDDEILLETAKDTLESLGATAETAASGEMALEMISERHLSGTNYAVVILDWKMPGMDGIEVIRRIRQIAGDDLPILLISAYDWSDIEDEAKAAGANGFVSKPLFRSTLYDRISELLGTRTEKAEAEEDNSDIAGMHILVAEDNDINWEIISVIMQMYGIECERAENGRICVDRLAGCEKGRFDLVFMDIQMPVMNGLEATKAIRVLKNWAKDIPIIAMTADAFSENVSECLAAGMNGHISKPIDVKIVLKEIRKVREARRQSTVLKVWEEK